MKSVHINSIDIDKLKNIRAKRERWVFCDDQYYYKFWVPNWTQARCTKVGIDRGFYDNETCPVLFSLIHDETGQRGYVMKKGKSYNSYEEICNVTTIESRKAFISAVLSNAVKSKGIFHDFCPGNIVVYNEKLSLIDLDAYRSFSLIFEKKKEEFEKFELDVRWKPYESAVRDITEKLPEMISTLLGMDKNMALIKNEESFKEILKEITK